MNIAEFVKKSEYLYHLTSFQNLDSILNMGRLISAKEMVLNSNLSKSEGEKVLSERRPEHFPVTLNGIQCLLRDQRPISEKALQKCLTDGWTVPDFIKSLNNRVFFWPTVRRLQVHYDRYHSERPKIIKVKTAELLQLNSNALRFCHLNSGATRCHPKWDGAPPPRGKDTFRRAHEFEFLPSAVAEVTFVSSCILPKEIFTANSPTGPWHSVTVN